MEDGHVVAWGDPERGGDDSSVRTECVKTIYSTVGGAFAALLSDGTIEPWGSKFYGGYMPDDLRLKLQLKLEQGISVVNIYSTIGAFTALLSDGTVEPWGNESYGGKLPDDLRLKLQLKLIQGIRAVDIYSAKVAFAAKFTDGSVEA